MTVNIHGYSTLIGNPATILRLMADARVFDDLAGDDYIAAVKEEASRCFDIDLNVTGNTIEARAKSLLQEMAKHGMITIEEEEK